MRLNFPKGKLQALTSSLIGLHFTYGWGFKIIPITLQAPEIEGTNPDTGATGREIDCSGFSRWTIWHAAGMLLPDGSMEQHQWAEANLKLVSVSDGHKTDGVIRIAFLRPTIVNGVQVEAGHVMLIENNTVYESHGHHGVDNSRLWGSMPFMSACEVYELATTG